jgi:DNA-binding phage protein
MFSASLSKCRLHRDSPLDGITRAKGMAQVARDAGLSRESLYKALSGERSPSFDTIVKVVAVLGLKLHAHVLQDHVPRSGGPVPLLR